MKKKHRSLHSPPYGKIIFALIVATTAAYFLWPSTQKSYLTQLSHVRHDAVLHLPEGDVFVQLATGERERELGLSFRPAIGENEGMLFVFDTPGQYGFWMKDMQFPIDIVWITSSGQVIHIEENIATSTYPKAFSNISSASYVLELDAYMARKYGVYLGTKINIANINR